MTVLRTVQHSLSFSRHLDQVPLIQGFADRCLSQLTFYYFLCYDGDEAAATASATIVPHVVWLGSGPYGAELAALELSSA